jgi:hypothetical protein
VSTLVKILVVGVLALGALGGIAIAQASNGADDPPGVELRGPCDEAEHAKDPRCTGTRAAAQKRQNRVRVDDRQRQHHRGDSRGRDDDSGSHSGRPGRSHAEDR